MSHPLDPMRTEIARAVGNLALLGLGFAMLALGGLSTIAALGLGLIVLLFSGGLSNLPPVWMLLAYFCGLGLSIGAIVASLEFLGGNDARRLVIAFVSNAAVLVGWSFVIF